MKDKYYTPDISEFHVGFEYAVFEKGQVYDSNLMTLVPIETEDKYYKYTYPDPYYGYKLDKLFAQKGLRVKYLDQEDIESLGFTQITDDCFNISNINYRGRMECDLRILIKKTILIYIIDKQDNSHTLFTGEIKNKSELKRIMKQTQILI